MCRAIRLAVRGAGGRAKLDAAKAWQWFCQEGPEERAPADPRSDQSGALRDKLLTEVKNVTSADCAAGWAHEALAASQPMPSSWRMHLSGGYSGSHGPKQPNSPVVISL